VTSECNLKGHVAPKSLGVAIDKVHSERGEVKVLTLIAGLTRVVAFSNIPRMVI
jgi:hypothetical protein